MSLIVLCGILVAGLWPFRAPRNEVSWLSQSNGLSFGKYGSILSAGVLAEDPREKGGPCSLEIWLEPRRIENTGTILGFYRPEANAVTFAVRQYHAGLVLERTTQGSFHDAKKATVSVYVDKVFNHQGPVLVTITSNQTATTVYADGTFLRKSTEFGLSRRDLTGRLVVGNSPVAAADWSGQFRGLAIYDRALTADEVSQHLLGWNKSEQEAFARKDGAAALYLFNEGSGNVVHNQTGSATALLIPDRFFVLSEPFLKRPWDEFHSNWSYWKNVFINIGGFIPFGFVFHAYFISARNSSGAVAKTIALGVVTSLTIEVLQAFLPTRDSGMTDLMTNSLGTAVGLIISMRTPSWAKLHEATPSIEKAITSSDAG